MGSHMDSSLKFSLTRHCRQKECRQCRVLGSVYTSRQMPHLRSSVKVTVFSGGVLGLNVMLGEGEGAGETPGEPAGDGLLASGDGALKISGLGDASRRSRGSISSLGCVVSGVGGEILSSGEAFRFSNLFGCSCSLGCATVALLA